MVLTIDLPGELESRLRQEAARQGLGTGEYVVATLRERLRQSDSPLVPHLSAAESRLLDQINVGFPPEFWGRYHELVARRDAENLSSDEQAELIGMCDQLEELNARRMQYLIELAKLRQVPLDTLMAQLGI